MKSEIIHLKGVFLFALFYNTFKEMGEYIVMESTKNTLHAAGFVSILFSLFIAVVWGGVLISFFKKIM